MEFGIQKLRNGKRQIIKRIELPNQKKNQNALKKRKKKEHWYLRILEAEKINLVKINEEISNKYLRRTMKFIEIKICNRILIKGINTGVARCVRYSGPFLRWTLEGLKHMDQKIRKLMNHKVLHQKGNIKPTV